MISYGVGSILVTKKFYGKVISMERKTVTLEWRKISTNESECIRTYTHKEVGRHLTDSDVVKPRDFLDDDLFLL